MDKHTIFVYGTLKKGCGLNYMLNTSTYIGEAVTMDKYKLHHINSLPMLEKEVKDDYVVGDVYRVNDKILEKLDKVEGIPDFYVREPIYVMLEDVNHLYAYVYFINQKVLEAEKKYDRNYCYGR
jgi:gamma-glutamylaminecyclotransferase